MTIDELLRGEGDVFHRKDNSPIASGIVYRVTVSQRSDLGRGLSETKGSLDIDYQQAAKLMGQELTLHLENGWWLDFFLTSTSGEITGTGPIRKDR